MLMLSAPPANCHCSGRYVQALCVRSSSLPMDHLIHIYRSPECGPCTQSLTESMAQSISICAHEHNRHCQQRGSARSSTCVSTMPPIVVKRRCHSNVPMRSRKAATSWFGSTRAIMIEAGWRLFAAIVSTVNMLLNDKHVDIYTGTVRRAKQR